MRSSVSSVYRVAGAAAFGAALLLASRTTPAAAQEPGTPSEPASGREHVVRRGDTLWDLAKSYLNDPFLWPRIFEVNRDVVRDPHWIYPNDRLRIPGLAAFGGAPGASGAEATGVALLPAEPQRPRFYSPSPAAASSKAAGEVYIRGEAPEVTTPSVRPGVFLSSPWLATRDELTVLGEVVGFASREKTEAEPGGVGGWIHRGERLYLRYGEAPPPEPDDRIMLVREGRRVEGFGRIVEPVAAVRVVERGAETMTVVVEQPLAPGEVGLLAVPLDPFPEAVILAPREAVEGPIGQLIEFEEPQPIPSITDRAFIDLGRADGVEVGDEVLVFLPERSAGRGYDTRLPAEPVARMRVVRVTERTATVQVVSLEQASLRPGLPVQVVSGRE